MRFKNTCWDGLPQRCCSVARRRRAAGSRHQSFTEQHILSAMTVQYLQKKGFQVQPQTNIAAVISRNAMVNKQIDITREYTGTSLIIFNRIDKRMSPQETYDTVKRPMRSWARYGSNRLT